MRRGHILWKAICLPQKNAHTRVFLVLAAFLIYYCVHIERIWRIRSLSAIDSNEMRMRENESLPDFPSVLQKTPYRNQAIQRRALIHPAFLNVDAVTPEIFEEKFFSQVEKSCLPACLYVDVGTNRGQALFPVLKSTSNLNVIAFEPNKEMCEFVRAKSEKEYPNRVRIYCNGVGASEQKLEFSKVEQKTASYHFVDESRLERSKKANVEIVEIVSIDSKVKTQDILLLKSDTQGFEKQVLMGATDSLRNGRVKYLIVEISYFLLRQHNTNEQEILDLIYGWGYACSYLAWHGVRAVDTGGNPIFGMLPSPNFDGPLVEFSDFANYLSPSGNPSGRSMWTDIICF